MAAINFARLIRLKDTEVLDLCVLMKENALWGLIIANPPKWPHLVKLPFW